MSNLGEPVSSQVFVGRTQSSKSEKLPKAGLGCKTEDSPGLLQRTRTEPSVHARTGDPEAHFQDEHSFPKALQEPGWRHRASNRASSLASLEAYSKSQDLDWGITLQFWSCLRSASHVHAHYGRKQAHYCVCRLNLRRLGDYHLSTAHLMFKSLFKVLQKGFSHLSRIAAAASLMDSAFPKCSLTRAS